MGEWSAENGALARLAHAGRARAVVNELTRDPDPAPSHEYEADPASGAGNCRCGMAEHHRRHPHEFMATGSRPDLCVCALPASARCHIPPGSSAEPDAGERGAS